MTQATANHKSEERYAFLNYCYGLHRTVEVRVLPAFSRPLSAIRAIQYTVETFEKFLSLPGALVPHVETASGSVAEFAAEGVADYTDALSVDAWTATLIAEVG